MSSDTNRNLDDTVENLDSDMEYGYLTAEQHAAWDDFENFEFDVRESLRLPANPVTIRKVDPCGPTS